MPKPKNLPGLITAFSNVLAGKDATFPIRAIEEKKIFANACPIKISYKVIGILVVTREES